MLLEDAHVAVCQEIELHRSELQQVFAWKVADPEGAEIRQSGPGTHGRKLVGGYVDGRRGPGILVRERLKQIWAHGRRVQDRKVGPARFWSLSLGNDRFTARFQGADPPEIEPLPILW